MVRPAQGREGTAHSRAGPIFAPHALVEPIEARLLPALPLLASAWISGLGLGLLRLRLRLRMRRPGLATLAATGWMRIGMLTSGAMFLGNVLPTSFLDRVIWNPLFHAVDQARGLAFVNHAPRHSLGWPVHVFASGALLAGAVAGHGRTVNKQRT